MLLARTNCCFVGLVCAASAALATSILAPNAWSVPLAYEGFDYPVGDINTLNGGTGWTAAWAATAANRGLVTAGGLTYTDANGNLLNVSGNYLFGNGQNGNADITRAFPATQNTGTTWYSFIGQRLQPHPNQDDNLRRAASFQLREGTAEKLAVGKITQAPPAVPNLNWSIFENGANTANLQQTTIPIFNQVFHVIRVDHVGASTDFDNAYLWENPLLDTEPQIAAADAQLLNVFDFTFNQIRYFVGNTTGTAPNQSLYSQMNIDEIRFGTTFADVAPFTPGGNQPGDFDSNGKVDAADYVYWRENLGTDIKYLEWRMNFGVGLGASAAIGGTTAIPEPATLALIALAAALVAGGRRYSRSAHTETSPASSTST